jgi:hypothetical protein
MAISRFRKTFAKLDPTLYVPEKRNLVPDITPLTNIATGMQSLFDDVSIIQPPAHLNNDAQDVQSKYLNPIKEAKDKAVETFRTNNSLEGVKALRDIKAFMIESNQPGGVAYNFKANAEASSKWNEDLKSRLAKGDITQDIYNSYVSTASKFKSYNDDGEYSTFQGGQPASYVNLKGMLDDSAGKYKADKNYVLQSDGIYTHKITNEIVDFKTVYSGIVQSVMADPKANAYLQDLQRVYGTEKAMKMLTDMAYSSADAAAHVNTDISMFKTDQLQLHRLKNAIDREDEKQAALDRGILINVPLKDEGNVALKLTTGITVDDEMKVDNGNVLNGFYRDSEGNIYQRQTNGQYQSLTGKSTGGKSVKDKTVIGVSGSSKEGGLVTMEGSKLVTGEGLKSVNLAKLDYTKDKKIIDFLDKELPGLRGIATNLSKESSNMSVNELNMAAIKRFKSNQQPLLQAQQLITPDNKNEIDKTSISNVASQLSGIVNLANVYKVDNNNKKIIPNDKEIASLETGLETLSWKKNNKDETEYKIIGKFDENNILYPNTYVIKDKKGNKYFIDTATPEQKNRSLLHQPILKALEQPGKAVRYDYAPPLVGVSMQNLSNGQQSVGMNIIPTSSYDGSTLDSNTKVGSISLISDPVFNANNELVSTNLVIKFTEGIFNPETNNFDKGQEYKVSVANNNLEGLKEIIGIK